MADYPNIPITGSVLKLEKLLNTDINETEINENSDNNSLPTSKLVYDSIKGALESGISSKMDKFGDIEITEDLGHIENIRIHTNAISTTYDSNVGSLTLGEGISLDIINTCRLLLYDGALELINNKSDGGLKIIGVASPTSDNDATNKRYVDDAIAASAMTTEIIDGTLYIK